MNQLLNLSTITKNGFFQDRIHFYDSCTSTNDIAHTIAQKEALNKTVIISPNQTNGRGRNNRSWLLPKGSVAISFIIKKPLLAHKILWLTSFCAQMLIRILNKLNITAKVKWPNDILIPCEKVKDKKLGFYKKLAGMLIETNMTNGILNYACVGIGINITRDRNLTNVIDSAGFISDVNPKILFKEFFLLFLNELEVSFEDFSDEQMINCLTELKNHHATVGHQIYFTHQDQALTGFALDLNFDGSLKVQLVDKSIISINSGDVWLNPNHNVY